MPTAYSILPTRFGDDRHGAIEEGLRRLGYRVVRGTGPGKDDRDVLVTWTVHKGYKFNTAHEFEEAGGRVIVCEEAHLKGLVRGEKLFSICLHDHNGAGSWTAREPGRWASFGIELKPWRESGEHILVREQRMIGSPLMASPPLWHERIMSQLKILTRRPVKLRYHPKSRMHPGRAAAQDSLDQQLRDCHALVTWAASDGTMALIAGVPVFAMAPHFFVRSACNLDLTQINHPAMPHRLPAFERLAWAQWSLREISFGETFEVLLNG